MNWTPQRFDKSFVDSSFVEITVLLWFAAGRAAWQTGGLVLAGSVAGAVVVLLLRRGSRARHEARPVAAEGTREIEANLARLQLEDTCGQLGAGCNRCAEQIGKIQRDLKTRRAGQTADAPKADDH